MIVDFSQVRGQDAHPVQRRARRLPGPRRRATTTTPAARTRAPAWSCPATARTRGPSCRSRSRPTAPAPAFNLTALNNAFKHHADGTRRLRVRPGPDHRRAGRLQLRVRHDLRRQRRLHQPDRHQQVRRDGAHQPAGRSTCSGSTTSRARTRSCKVQIEPKALHDEMNSAAFDEFGRMTANLGLEAVPATPAAAEHPALPVHRAVDRGHRRRPTCRRATSSVQPISSGTDGTQIWKITHNGVDTHPIHFHLYDVQVLNRVTWDNIIIPTEAVELGWKDTVRVSPLEDTIVALRPIIPTLPFEIPNSIRPLSPMMPLGAEPRPDRDRSSTRPATRSRRPCQRARQLRLGVRLPLPHPHPRGDGHDAAGARSRCRRSRPTAR